MRYRDFFEGLAVDVLIVLLVLFAGCCAFAQGGMGPGPGMVHSTGGGGSTTITVTDGSAQTGAFGSLPSFSMAVGSYNAASDDLFFFSGSDQASANNPPTIGGVVATQGSVNADTKTGVFYIPRGSGVSVSAGSVTVSNLGFQGACGFVIGYASGGASGTPSSSGTTAFTFFASPNQISGVVASGGAGVGFWWNNTPSSLPISWLPSGWARVAASEKSQTADNGSQVSAAVQGTPAAGTYNLDSQLTAGAYAFIAFQ